MSQDNRITSRPGPRSVPGALKDRQGPEAVIRRECEDRRVTGAMDAPARCRRLTAAARLHAVHCNAKGNVRRRTVYRRP
jgi:hypothetical protein